MCPTLSFLRRSKWRRVAAFIEHKGGLGLRFPACRGDVYLRAAARTFTWAKGFLSLSGLRKLIAWLGRDSVWDWFTWSSEFWHQRLNFTEYLATHRWNQNLTRDCSSEFRIGKSKKNNLTRLAFCAWEQVQDLGGWHVWCLVGLGEIGPEDPNFKIKTWPLGF